MEVRLETQLSDIADEVSAITAVVRPILTGLLFALKRDIVDEVGGIESVKLKMLPRLYRRGDGDCGICFEYAVHDAIRRGEGSVVERVEDALSSFCRVPGGNPASILFGAEKSGAIQLIDTSRDLLTDESALLVGARGRPVKLKRHMDSISTAFRKPSARNSLPQSISGLWKADLFVGHSDADRWVGTTVKVNERQLEAAKGLRIGVVPERQGQSDALRADDRKNLIICPLPYDGAFMETFYMGWQVVQQFIAADANVPGEDALPQPQARQVARYLADRRESTVLRAIQVLEPLAQPELLETQSHDAELVTRREAESDTGALLAPKSRTLS